MVIHCLLCIPKDAPQLPLFPPPRPPPPPLSFESSRFKSSRVLLRLAVLPFTRYRLPQGTAFPRQGEQAWRAPIMFSFFSPASPVVVTTLTSLKFFISHFTSHEAHSRCLSSPRRLGCALGSGGGKGAIYSIWPFQLSYPSVRVHACGCTCVCAVHQKSAAG